MRGTALPRLRICVVAHLALLLSADGATGHNGSDTVAVAVEVRRGEVGETGDLPLPEAGFGSSVAAGPGKTWQAGLGARHGLWQTFDVSDGIPDPVVLAIGQDRAGRLWFGTEKRGVVRYDGTHMTVFTSADGLAPGLVLSILEDREGNIWFGTEGSGVSRYDGQTFTTFTGEDGLAGSTVVDIVQGPDGLWLATDGGISHYDGQGFETVAAAWSVLPDREGNIWLGTPGGLRKYGRDSLGVGGEDFETFPGPTSSGQWLVEDAQGNLWCGFWERGIGAVRFDGESYRTFTTADGLPDNRVMAGALDGNGDLWLATFGGGVSRFDGKRFTSFTQADGLAHNEVFSIFEDREGNLWFGTLGGVSRYGGGQLTHYGEEDGLADEYVRCLLEDSNGHLWFGTWRAGVSRYDGERFTTFTVADGLVDDRVLSLMEDGEGNIWVGTPEGVSRWDGQGFTSFHTSDGLADNRVWSMLTDRDGTLWFGTKEGVSQYDGYRFTILDNSSGGLAGVSVSDILQDRHGQLWFATEGAGVISYDGETFTAHTSADGLASDIVTAAAEDSEGQLWFGTVDGVSRFDGTGFANFTTADGLAPGMALDIVEARDGQLWFGTGGGVSRFDGLVFQNLLRRDGLTSNVAFDLLEDGDGDMWIATIGGVTRYRSRPGSPQIRLEDVVADRRYGPVARLELPASQGFVIFEFLGQSFKTRPDQMAYVYRLQGADSQWRATREAKVEYTDLAVGEYVFQVKAVDRDLNRSERAATVLVVVRPAYGRIATISGGVLAAVLLVAASAYGIKGRRERDQVREALVREQRKRIDVQQEMMGELEEANRRIQEATHHKSDFLARMSHDLRTPMNAIIGYTRILMRRAKDTLGARQYQNLRNVESSAAHLLSLINDILDLAKIEAGRIEVHPEEVDLARLVKECIATVATLVKPGVRLETEIDAIEPMRTDPDRLQRVLMNFLSNAAKFTEAGRIAVSVKKLPGDAVELAVADTGRGIPAADLPHIFEEFRQVESKQGDRQPQGTGLGLSIAKRSVELLGGTIAAESEVGVGSRFSIRVGDYPRENA